MYQLRRDFSTPKNDELRPAVSKELHQLHRKIWVYKLSKNWKVLTEFYCTLLYTQLYTHIKSCVQQEEESLYQQTGLKFEEETSKILHLEHGFI